jgi:hypothetical protein
MCLSRSQLLLFPGLPVFVLVVALGGCHTCCVCSEWLLLQFFLQSSCCFRCSVLVVTHTILTTPCMRLFWVSWLLVRPSLLQLGLLQLGLLQFTSAYMPMQAFQWNEAGARWHDNRVTERMCGMRLDRREAERRERRRAHHNLSHLGL